MRGYEGFTFIFFRCASRLFLPMRGYEITGSSGTGKTELVISSHEGLWGQPIQGISRPGGSYFFPWGVMRLVVTTRKACAVGVISSHEGLWVARGEVTAKQRTSYFFPWGVMRVMSRAVLLRENWLFLPMRGYELRSDLPGVSTWIVISFHEGLWGINPARIGYPGIRLFLPMRGYELRSDLPGVSTWIVISSHEGLWASGSWFTGASRACYFFPWGVMSWHNRPRLGRWFCRFSQILFMHILCRVFCKWLKSGGWKHISCMKNLCRKDKINSPDPDPDPVPEGTIFITLQYMKILQIRLFQLFRYCFNGYYNYMNYILKKNIIFIRPIRVIFITGLINYIIKVTFRKIKI